MSHLILAPPVAFLAYLLLVGILSLLGRRLSGANRSTAPYASGEAEPGSVGGLSPGYQPFFLTALYFAVLHLGALMLGSSNFSPASAIYVIGLILALMALVAG